MVYFPKATNQTKGRILCTEDDVDTRELIALILTSHGFEVTCVDAAERAIELARTQKFDLYLLDNWVPGLDGISLCAKLREFDSKTPVLFYSAAAYESDVRLAHDSGAQAYLIKPVSNDDLLSEVCRLIEVLPPTS